MQKKKYSPCADFCSTKYSDGILPIDTYKGDVDEITQVGLTHDWESLRTSIMEHGLSTQHCPHRCHRRAVPLCQMPQMESNHLEITCPLRSPKRGPLKQIVPSYNTLKNNYTLLWDMKSNDGYIKVVSVMQKFLIQAISGNWSYNPKNYPDNEVPISVMAQDLLTTYKYGWKTSYYQNTYDMKSDEPDDVEEVKPQLEKLFTELSEEVECDSCTI